MTCSGIRRSGFCPCSAEPSAPISLADSASTEVSARRIVDKTVMAPGAVGVRTQAGRVGPYPSVLTRRTDRERIAGGSRTDRGRIAGAAVGFIRAERAGGGVGQTAPRPDLEARM
ncbi:hypothetical protein KFL_001460260 [Klebsormidium nitens]|uniref:Uncharacterized protein n=1 Tax=Klebsormidium nitens TaxID=105231 RepID=A0A1Y1I2J0_KLENI|nr:hypothetical protein KFL_001460260 [Klebsormidium nitens]|eukprot:GAQ83401.1 hypothetical protein KFL_001460260 [Klebsormidium nitens]